MLGRGDHRNADYEAGGKQPGRDVLSDLKLSHHSLSLSVLNWTDRNKIQESCPAAGQTGAVTLRLGNIFRAVRSGKR
jgi:hypothetical protein